MIFVLTEKITCKFTSENVQCIHDNSGLAQYGWRLPSFMLIAAELY